MIRVLFLDADDTLWHNELHFRKSEAEFYELLATHGRPDELEKRLLERERMNMKLYGFGVKGFMLSMMEVLLAVVPAGCEGMHEYVEGVMDIGRRQLTAEVRLLDGVEDVLKELNGKYKLVLATKGDLLDQERKLRMSGLAEYFDAVEVMSDKRECDYERLFVRYGVEVGEAIMVGNSLKSDVIPVLKLGGWAVHVPYPLTWALDVHDDEVVSDRFREIGCLNELIDLLGELDYVS